ncbi:MAG: metal-dependent hydrolase [Cyanobacteria bacterium J06634_6]
MPSPIAHSASGYLLSRLPIAKNTLPGKVMTLTPITALYGIFVSNLPDLDFVPQVITGIRFHRGPSHSILAALLVSALLTLIVHQVRRHARYRSLFITTLGFYGVHIFMDLFTAGGSGLPLLWPLSDRTFRAPFSIFPAVHHSRGLLDPSHFTFISIELLYIVAVFLAIGIIKSRWPQKTQKKDL